MKLLVKNLIKERFEGEKSIWDSITKSKLPTFGSNVKTVTVKIKDQLVQVKEEHKLISRFLIVCRTRHDIDLQSYLGDYEFSVAPRSLFTPDGQLYKSTNNSVNETENLTNKHKIFYLIQVQFQVEGTVLQFLRAWR